MWLISAPSSHTQLLKLCFNMWLPFNCLHRLKVLVLMLFAAAVLIFLRSKQWFCLSMSKYSQKVISWKKQTCYWDALKEKSDGLVSKTLKSSFCTWPCCGHVEQQWSSQLAVLSKTMQKYFPSQLFACMSFQNKCSFCSGSLVPCVRMVLTSMCGCSLVRAFGKNCNAHNNDKGSLSLYRKCALLRKRRLQNVRLQQSMQLMEDDWKTRRVRGGKRRGGVTVGTVGGPQSAFVYLSVLEENKCVLWLVALFVCLFVFLGQYS